MRRPYFRSRCSVDTASFSQSSATRSHASLSSWLNALLACSLVSSACLRNRSASSWTMPDNDMVQLLIQLRRPVQWKNNAQTKRLVVPALPRIANATKLFMSSDHAADNATELNDAQRRWIMSGQRNPPVAA